jgi:hypothetical protein
MSASASEYTIGGDVPLKVNVANKTTRSPDFICAEAERIWKAVKESGMLRQKDDSPARIKYLDDMQRKESDFQSSFPLVLRWMIQVGEYRPKAFYKYVLKYGKASQDGIPDEKAYMRLQAEYLVLLFTEKNPRENATQVNIYRERISQMLIDESESFQKMQAEAAAEMKAIKKDKDAKDRQEMYALLLKRKVEAEQDPAGLK